MMSLETVWYQASQTMRLSNFDVHVWRACFSPAMICLGSLQRSLSADEVARAARFHFAADRRRFILARGILRDVLSRYLGRPPGAIEFRYSVHGKPALADVAASGGLCFNLSHCHDMALIAVARGREVGVDIEDLGRKIAYDEIAERFFSRRERACLQALPANLKPQAFFNCWTRKEAYIKAHGEGLALPLEQFDVSLTPGVPAALLAIRNHAEEARRWSLQALAPGAGYAAALAVEGQGWQLSCWQWRPSA